MNVLILYPWFRFASVVTFEEPLGILYLASALMKAGCKVKVADLTFQRNMDGLETMAGWADVMCVSSPTPLFGTAVEILNYIKKSNPGIPTVIGGPHATAEPDDALSHGFDVAVIGEGETTLVDLVETMGRGGSVENVRGVAYKNDDVLRFTPPRPFISNLDELPLPARHFIDYSRYRRLGIISMRGCPHRCSYCKPIQDKLFGKKLRRRSLGNVVQEIEELITHYGDRAVGFKDDTFTVHKTEWFERFREELRHRNLRPHWQCNSRVDTVDFDKLKAMKAAGCTQVFFGIESGSQRILDYYRKDITVKRIADTFAECHRVGIRPCASIMLGAPPETRDDLEKTYQLVKRIKPFNWHVHVTTPICGSYLYDQVKAEKRFGSQTDYGVYEPTGNLYRNLLPMKLDNLSVQDIAEYRDRINSCMKFRVLFRALVNPGLWKEFVMSPALRTIAYRFMLRHFRISKRPKAS
jgi:anaerobic magnesium-protoporphyrin IX monomethyl ester cyclase